MPVTAVKSKNRPLFFINSLDDHYAKVLDKALSYYPEGYERCDKYISGEWDGRECLFKRARNGSYYFPVGLIGQVKRVIEAFGDQLVVVGIEDIDHTTDHRRLGLQWRSGIELRDYQYQALQELLGSTLGGGVVALPTSAGKTILALKYILYRDLPFLVLVHRKELLHQWADEIKLHLGVDAGLIGDSVYNPSPIGNVAMVQTLNADKKKIPDADVLISDECHNVPCDTAFSVCSHINARFRCGLSATAYREDGAEMKIWAACGSIVSKISVADLIDMGYVARPEFRFVRLNPMKMPRGVDWATVYQEGVVSNIERNNAIIKISIDLANNNRQTYVHVMRIDHGKYLESKIGNVIKETVFLQGKDTSKKRKKIIQDFKDGKIRVLISTLLKEGVNLPSMDALIYAAGYKSSVMAIQTVGRALRKMEGKSDAIIVDFIDSGQRQLAQHSDQRVRTYQETYGKYCELNFVEIQ